jgi:hypothetical protein
VEDKFYDFVKKEIKYFTNRTVRAWSKISLIQDLSFTAENLVIIG